MLYILLSPEVFGSTILALLSITSHFMFNPQDWRRFKRFISVQKKKPIWLGYLESIGIVGLLLTLGGLMWGQGDPRYFPYFCISVYTAIGIVTLDLFYRIRGFLKAFLVLLLAAVLIWGFTSSFVAIDVPFDVTAQGYGVIYQDGQVDEGITWDHRFYKVKAWLDNSSDYDLRDAVVVIKPDYPIVSIVEGQGMCNPHIRDISGEVELARIHDNQAYAFPMGILASSMGKEIRCDKLPAHTRIPVVIAMARMECPAFTHSGTIFDSWYTITYGNGTQEQSLWLGRPANNFCFSENRPLPQRLKGGMSYVVLGRREQHPYDFKIMDMFRQFSGIK